jgi:cofilin
MSTGCNVTEPVVLQYNEFKLQRPPFDYRYFTYQIEGEEDIIIEGTGERDESWGDFVEVMTGFDLSDLSRSRPRGRCRYGIFDMSAIHQLPNPTMVFVTWCPEDAPVREKMVYSGSKEMIKRVLVGTHLHVNATSIEELFLNTVNEQVCTT